MHELDAGSPLVDWFWMWKCRQGPIELVIVRGWKRWGEDGVNSTASCHDV